MTTRRKIEERRVFSREEKIYFLSKSNNRCSHCGKPLTLETMSVEHATPIGKAGTNESANLVALCKDCNQKKADMVICKDIANYYKYLEPKYIFELVDYIDEYNKKVNWLDYNNFLPDEAFVMTPIGIPCEEDWVRFKKELKVLEKLVLRRAVYSDLDSLMDFIIKKSDNAYIDIDDFISDFFMLGCWYILYNGAKEIVGCFAVRIGDFAESLVPIIEELMCSSRYVREMSFAVQEIVNCVVRKSKLVHLTSVITAYKNNTGAIKVVSELPFLKKEIESSTGLALYVISVSVVKPNRGIEFYRKKQNQYFLPLLQRQVRNCKMLLSREDLVSIKETYYFHSKLWIEACS